MGIIKQIHIVAEEIAVELIDRLDGNPAAVSLALEHINSLIGDAPDTGDAA